MPGSGYVELDHTADWALRARGIDLPDLFVQAAVGMLSLSNPLPRSGRAPLHRAVHILASDRETLLVRWLEELLFILETERQVPLAVQASITPGLELVAELRTTPVDRPGRAIKAVTFHGLQIVDSDGGLEATIVFDV